MLYQAAIQPAPARRESGSGTALSFFGAQRWKLSHIPPRRIYHQYWGWRASYLDAQSLVMATKHDELEKIAFKLFRILHGPGDGGSEFEFRMQNPAVIDGWFKLAKKFRKEELRRISGDQLIAGIKALSPPMKALGAIIKEVTCTGNAGALYEDNWNEDYQIEISLTVRELRRINEYVEALKRTYEP